VVGAALADWPTDEAYLQVGIDQLTLHARPGRRLLSHVRVRPPGPRAGESPVADLSLFAPDGTLMATVAGVRLKPTGARCAAETPAEGVSGRLYEVRWLPQPQPADARLASHDETRSALRRRLNECLTRPGLAEFRGALTALEALCAHFVVSGLDALG